MAINLRCCGDLLKAALKKCFPCVRAFSDDPIQQSMATPSGYTVLHLVVCDFPILEYILPKTLKYIKKKTGIIQLALRILQYYQGVMVY